ncbi:hypothetical protein HKBW3S03_01170, partial [Candidatus Hakubella thermalkaliphila]
MMSMLGVLPSIANATTISARIDSYSPSSPVEVTVGSSTTISVAFTNTGNTAWSFIAGVTVWDSNGNQVANYSATLSTPLQPAQSTTVTWNHTVHQAGEYRLQFGVWKATPYISENLLDKKPSPSQRLIIGTTSPTSLPNQPPTCSLSANPTSGKAPLTVTFSMSASDPDGSISAWVLDVNGDGRADYSGYGNPSPTQTHTYAASASYSVVLMVSDNKGANASATQTISVGSVNQPPICSLSANPRSGSAPLTVAFTMSASDPDGSISAWALDVNGDGRVDYSGSGNPPSTQAHIYTSPGTYAVILVVSDNNGATASATEAISASSPSTIIKPSPPVPSSPGSSSSPGPTTPTLTPTLQWSRVPNADYYALAISVYPYGSGNLVYNPQRVVGTSLTVPSGVLEPGKQYRWNLQAYNRAGWSELSSILYFQTPPQDIITARIDSWSVDPRQVQVGQSVVLSMNFTNTGTTTHTFIAGASLWRPDGSSVDFEREVTLSRGASTSVSWTRPIDQAGSWDVQFAVWRQKPFTSANLLTKAPSSKAVGYIRATSVVQRPSPPVPSSPGS